MEWLELLTSAAGGGLFGLVGAGFKQFMSWKAQQARYQYEINMAEQERLNLAAEVELSKVKGAIDLELAESEADAKGLQASLAHDASITGTSQWIADLRGSVRPVLTYGLVVGTFIIVMAQHENPWNEELIFMTMTAVTWWFGDRPPKGSNAR